MVTALDSNTFGVTRVFNLSTASIVLNTLLSAAILLLNSVCPMAMMRGRLLTETRKSIYMGSLATLNVLTGTLLITVIP